VHDDDKDYETLGPPPLMTVVDVTGSERGGRRADVCDWLQTTPLTANHRRRLHRSVV